MPLYFLFLSQNFLTPFKKLNEHYQFGEIFFTQEELWSFFRNELANISLEEPLRELLSKIKTKNVLKRQVLIDLNFLVKNRLDYLIYTSRISKIKLLLPYLQKETIDFSLQIPNKYLIKGLQQKSILRKAFEGKLPQEILNQEKEGLSPPLDYIKKLIFSIPQCELYTNGMKIWLILNLVNWYEGLGKK